MSYKNSDMYKAFILKLDGLKDRLSGQEDHALSKLGMFANDAFDEQQAEIEALTNALHKIRNATRVNGDSEDILDKIYRVASDALSESDTNND